MRILNLAVDCDKLDRNRLKRIELPDVSNRERVATDEELKELRKAALAELWRVATVALHTGLREGKILEIGRSWIRLREDGPWLTLPASRTRYKGTPREIPLNRLAYQALEPEMSVQDLEDWLKMGRIEDRVFTRWNPNSFTMAWRRLCKTAKVQDLHFHDLRHTFTTRLQNLGVSLEVRAALLGHRVGSMSGDLFGGQAM